MKQQKRWYWWLGLYMVIGWILVSIPAWLTQIPIMIRDDFVAGLGYAIGNLIVLVIGIVLMKKGKAKVRLAKQVEDITNA